MNFKGSVVALTGFLGLIAISANSVQAKKGSGRSKSIPMDVAEEEESRTSRGCIDAVGMTLPQTSSAEYGPSTEERYQNYDHPSSETDMGSDIPW